MNRLEQMKARQGMLAYEEVIWLIKRLEDAQRTMRRMGKNQKCFLPRCQLAPFARLGVGNPQLVAFADLVRHDAQRWLKSLEEE